MLFITQYLSQVTSKRFTSYFLHVGELTGIVWASHLLCGRICLWANSLVANSPFSTLSEMKNRIHTVRFLGKIKSGFLNPKTDFAFYY